MFRSRGFIGRLVIAAGVPVVVVALVNRSGWLEGAGGAIAVFFVVAWVGAFFLFRGDQRVGKKRRRRRKRKSTLR